MILEMKSYSSIEQETGQDSSDSKNFSVKVGPLEDLVHDAVVALCRFHRSHRRKTSKKNLEQNSAILNFG